MRLSISSSEPKLKPPVDRGFKTEILVLLTALVVVGLFNAGALNLNHAHELDMSRPNNAPRPNEFALLHHFPQAADALLAQPGTHLVLLGNSLTENGYDLDLLDTLLQEAGHGEIHAASLALAGSDPVEWYYNLDRNFIRRDRIPQAVVINMSPDGIADSVPAGYRIGWLARETGWLDVPRVLTGDLANVELDGQYLLARFSELYATRWDVRAMVLMSLIPNTHEGTQWVNDRQAIPSSAGGQTAPRKTYTLLNRLLALLESRHIRPILVAMPAREPYELDGDLLPILQQHRVAFVDGRLTPGLTPTDFEDGWHLNPAGSLTFTRYIAGKLADAATQR